MLDATLAKKFKMDGDGSSEVFLTVSNLTNERAPLLGVNSGLPGLTYATQPYYDDMGRFFTAGVKVSF